jgi:hypothetical protein
MSPLMDGEYCAAAILEFRRKPDITAIFQVNLVVGAFSVMPVKRLSIFTSLVSFDASPKPLILCLEPVPDGSANMAFRL